MKNEEVLKALKENMKRERKGQAQFLFYLSEVDERRLFLPKYPSLFQFCVKELGLSEASTCKRIQVARLSRKYPKILERIASGKLTLTNACVVAPTVTQENHQALLTEVEGKSKYEVEKMVAPTFPRECREKLKPISKTHTMFVFQGDDETVAMYRALQDRLRHKYPKGKIEEIVKEAITLLYEKTNPTRVTKRKSLLSSTAKRTRYIAAETRRTIWKRDEGKCQKCGSRAFLQIDHIKPWSLGGTNEPENLRLLCGAHNRYRNSWETGARIPTPSCAAAGPTLPTAGASSPCHEPSL